MKKTSLIKAVQDLAALQEFTRDDTPGETWVGSVRVFGEIVSVTKVFEKVEEIGKIQSDFLWGLGKRAVAAGPDAHWLAGMCGLWAIALGDGPKPGVEVGTIIHRGFRGNDIIGSTWLSDWDKDVMGAYEVHGVSLLAECKAIWGQIVKEGAKEHRRRNGAVVEHMQSNSSPRIGMDKVMKACIEGWWMDAEARSRSDAASEAIRGALCELELRSGKRVVQKPVESLVKSRARL